MHKAQGLCGRCVSVGAIPLLGYLLIRTALGSHEMAPWQTPQRPHNGLGSEREMEKEAKRRGAYPSWGRTTPGPCCPTAAPAVCRGCSEAAPFAAAHIWPLWPGDTVLGHFTFGHIITGGTSRLLAHGAELGGEGRHLGAHPVNPFLEAAGSFPGCPRCPWARGHSPAGPCYCSRAPREDQRSRPGRAARHRNSRGLAELFAFGTTPRRSSAQHKYLCG